MFDYYLIYNTFAGDRAYIVIHIYIYNSNTSYYLHDATNKNVSN